MTDLQLFTKIYIIESKLNKKDTDYLLDFVDTSNDNDILNLLFTGVPEKISEEKIQKLNEMYEESGLKILIEVPYIINWGATSSNAVTKSIAKAFWSLSQKVTGKKPFASLNDVEVWLSKADAEQVKDMGTHLLMGAYTVSAYAALVILYFIADRLTKRFLTQAARACRGFEGKMKTVCMNKFKVKAAEKQIETLKKGKSMCSNTKKPDYCKAKIDSRVHAYEAKIRKLEIVNKKLETKVKT